MSTMDKKTRAEEMLDRAYDELKAVPPGMATARIAAEVGIGYALLAAGEDAEFFFGMFAGPDGRATILSLR
jgi:hypothetical protein